MANRSLGTLTIDLIAKTGLLEQGMDRAGRATDKMARETQRKLDRWARDFDKAFAAVTVAATAAFTGISVAVNKSIDTMIELGVQAKQVAMPIKDFTAFAAAANDAEVDTTAFTTSLVQLARSLQMAKQGSAQYSSAFKSLGIDPSKLDTTKQALLAISDAFEKYRDDTNKVAVAQQLLGQSGTRMIAFLDEGSKALQEQAGHALDLGIAYGDDVNQAVAAFDAQQDELRDTMAGLTRTLAVGLLPALTSVNKLMADFAQSEDAKEFASSLANNMLVLGRAGIVVAGAFDTIGKSIGGASAIAAASLHNFDPTAFLRGPGAVAQQLAKNFSAVQTTAKTVTDDLGATVESWMRRIDEFGQGAQAAIANVAPNAGKPSNDKPSIPAVDPHVSQQVAKVQAAEDYTKALRDQVLQLQLAGKQFELYQLASRGASGADLDYASSLIDLRDKLKQQADAQKTLTDFIAQHRAEIEGVSDAVLQFRDTTELATKALNEHLLQWDEYERIVSGAAEKLKGHVGEQFDQMDEFAKQAARNMQDAFASFLFDPFKDGVKGMLGNFADMLRQMAAQQLSAKLFDSIGGWGTKNAGAGGFEGWLAGLAGIFGGGRAAGGPVAAGGLYQVNESGPEVLAVGGRQFLMMGPQNGVVSPTKSRATGGTTINVAVQPTSTHRTAEQVATAISRQQRLAEARNG